MLFFALFPSPSFSLCLFVCRNPVTLSAVPQPSLSSLSSCPHAALSLFASSVFLSLFRPLANHFSPSVTRQTGFCSRQSIYGYIIVHLLMIVHFRLLMIVHLYMSIFKSFPLCPCLISPCTLSLPLCHAGSQFDRSRKWYFPAGRLFSRVTQSGPCGSGLKTSTGGSDVQVVNALERPFADSCFCHSVRANVCVCVCVCVCERNLIHKCAHLFS